jgi:hypothetical protein
VVPNGAVDDALCSKTCWHAFSSSSIQCAAQCAAAAVPHGMNSTAEVAPGSPLAFTGCCIQCKLPCNAVGSISSSNPHTLVIAAGLQCCCIFVIKDACSCLSRLSCDCVVFPFYDPGIGLCKCLWRS